MTRSEPFHKKTCKGKDQTDHKHVCNHEPLHDVQLDAEGQRELGEGDVESGFAVHAGKTAKVQTHHTEVRMVDYNARLGERGILGLCHEEELPFFKGREALSPKNKKAFVATATNASYG